MMQKKKPIAGKIVLFFIIASAILYYLYQQTAIPELIFLIGLAIIILICIGAIVYPDKNQWKEYTVIPIKRKR